MKFRSQKYAACQLISAINARIFLGGKDISNELFEWLVNLVCARYGGALGVEKAYPYLGLGCHNGPTGPMDLNWIKKNLPVELGIYSTKWGRHSILVHKVNGDILHVTNNWRHNSLHWSTYRSHGYMSNKEKCMPFAHQRTMRSFFKA